MLKLLNDWLRRPAGRYREGVAIFKACAPPAIRKKYLAWFEQAEGEPGAFDPHMTMLVNKVRDIRDKARLNPAAFAKATLALEGQQTVQDADAKDREIAELHGHIGQLEQEIADLEADGEVHQEEIEAKAAEVERLEARLEELGGEYERLKERRGVQVVRHGDLPDDIRRLYDRVREITPLMGSLHAEIGNEKTTPARRKKLVQELVALDDERRAAWDAIDAWAEGKEVDLPEGKQDAQGYSDDRLVRGAQMARRVERLKENIAHSRRVAEETDRENIRANARKRVAAYQAELEELEAQLKEADDPAGEEHDG